MEQPNVASQTPECQPHPCGCEGSPLTSERPPHPPKRRGRTAWYFVCLVILNLLLGFYALYAMGLVMQFDWQARGDEISILQTVLMVILAFSPFLLTIVFNRLLYRIFRGRRHRFPRGTVLLAVLVLIVVQALTIMLTLRYGLVEGATGIGMGDYVNFFSEITG